MLRSNLTRRLAATTALAGAAALALVGCSASTAATTVADDCTPADSGLTTHTPGTLTVGVPENPPYTQTSGSSASGLEIEIVEKLAAAECLDLAYVPITYANGIPMISEQKKTDMITGGWYVTEARAEQVGFTSPTYYDSMAIISKDGIDTVEGLEGIGAVGSGAGFSWEADMSAILGSSFSNYPGTVEMKQDLQSGRIQAALDGYGVAKYAYKDTDFQVEVAQPDDRVAITTSAPVAAFPIAKENTALSDAFSALIDQYREDGTLAGFLADYDLDESLLIPADVAATSLR
ncbi:MULTISPECIES: transporter substrate-binding domain-containing protein [unclassified Rathayibacter]|uniref:substrate-binding periplasmic protein n=1 Tax=unclassified Rathayibacter TaxID=2609250 RepID=UPI001053A65C|nr:MULTISPECIES: transporter substrate-binding domain-containing protein [unclassified Rathayibacter]TCL79429.1 polar amino acid transport system substrate-binding protein [Rathayibacter sp. PhB192]TCM25302.1 polar amino acid transport system substrate-binding protein [Rathayibacter sp. PhB179]